MDLVRVHLNDWQSGGAGIVSFNTAPQVVPALNSAIREVYRKLRLVGAPTLIRDNVLVNLPAAPVTGPTIQTYLAFNGFFDGSKFLLTPQNVFLTDAANQVWLLGCTLGGLAVEVTAVNVPAGTPAPSFYPLQDITTGVSYNLFVQTDGSLAVIATVPQITGLATQLPVTDSAGTVYAIQVDSGAIQDQNLSLFGGGVSLPADLMYPIELWEQQTNSALPFVRMEQPESGLPSPWNQTFALRYWEWRGGAQITAGTGGGDALWFVGALCPITIRIRYMAALTQFISPLTFSSSYIPVMDCEEAVALKTAYIISAALSGITPGVQDLATRYAEAINDLRGEQVRRQQTVDYARPGYLSEKSGDNTYTTTANLL